MEAPKDETAQSQQLNMDVLDEIHRESHTRAISRVLSTDIALITFAKIIDGLPLDSVAYDSSSGGPLPEHPVQGHTELCPDVLEKTQEFHRGFRLEILCFESRIWKAYLITEQVALSISGASLGSRAFRTRLIELVAVAIHQIAVLLFSLDTDLHKHDDITNWAPPKAGSVLDEMFWDEFHNGPLRLYLSSGEARILGGVVLFDGHPNGDPDHVYLLPDRREVTYRIYQLFPEQKEALLEFLTTESEPSADTLPILGDKKNVHRIDPEEPIEETGIYRDIWERKFRPPQLNDRRLRDVWDTFDFPTRADKYAASVRARERKYKFDYGDEDPAGLFE